MKNNRYTPWIAVVVLVLINACTNTSDREHDELHTIAPHNKGDLTDYFHYSSNSQPIVSGHRGGVTRGYPENSLATFENTLRHTQSFFEIDPRLTKDSVIVLMHDESLARTTNGQENVGDYTLEELKRFKLKDDEGNLTGYNIPTLDEAIEWSRGKTILNLDEKDVPKAMTVRKIEEHQAEAFVIVTVHSAEEALVYFSANPRIMYSAFVKTKEALKEYEQLKIPWDNVAIAYIGSEIKRENDELINMLHERGVKVMISSAPSYDKLPDSVARGKAYRDIISSGADIIESDRPIEVAAALEGK